MKRVALSLLLVVLLLNAARAVCDPSRTLAPVPNEIASSHFVVTINGQQTPVMHAALNLYFLNFEASRHARISVTAPTDDFWAKGVEVQPWRLGIRPQRNGRTISFTLDGPAKITISRPGDYLAEAEMLYLFANPAQKNAPPVARPGLRVIGPGAHTEDLDPQTGDTIYLAPGAVVFGSLNLWQVNNVRVFGPGVIVYDGPQNPADDDGWMHKKNWHCIVMDQAHDISISDLTCVVRSRTWQIQMKDSRRIVFDNVKVIGANAGNANADGMDWLGGGDTVVRNSFLRAADDVFALQSSWDGYGPAALAAEGHPVTNISVENTVVSTSISNIVRVAWPKKNFSGGNFSMTDSDVLHAGLGGCGVPFALMELWASPDGRGESHGFHFANIRMEDWYSLVNVQQPTPVRDVHFTDIAGLTSPSLVPSALRGNVADVTLDNVVLAGRHVESAAEVPISEADGALAATVTNTAPPVQLITSHGWLHPHQNVLFEARSPDKTAHLRYRWVFGDGTIRSGRKVRHRFADAEGTLLDGSGLYRVLLHVESRQGRQTWISVPTIIREQRPAPRVAAETPSVPGIAFELRTLSAAAESQAADSGAVTSGAASSLNLAEIPHPDTNYALKLATNMDVPEDGGYLFTVIANDASSISIDGSLLGSAPVPFAQVCGLAGNAARAITVAAELTRGLHRLEVTESHTLGVDNFQVLWQPPGLPMSAIPPDRLSH